MRPSKIDDPRWSRRGFLSRLGVAAAVSPFVPLLNASGQESLFPRRLILFFTPHGTVLDAWKPTGTATDFQLGPILSPLVRHKAKLAVVSGMNIAAPGVGAPHTKGPAILWTGSPLLDDMTFTRSDGSGGMYYGWNSGPSADQVIAARLAPPTPYRSIELGVRPGNNSFPGSRMIYSAAKQPLAPEASPYNAAGRLFTGDMGGTSALEKLLAERKSSIDIVKADLDGLMRRTGVEDRRKLDAHLEAIRGIEMRLSVKPRACEAPLLGNRLDPGAVTNAPAMFDRQSEVIAAALACDQTRIASLQYRLGENDTDTYTWLGITHEGHHLISHAGDSDTFEKGNLIKIYTWYAERFAHLLDQLDAIPEGNGTLLDHSMVVWGSELGKGNSHGFYSVPFVVAGGAGGRLRTGRFLDLKGVLHNRLLVSMFHAMGLPDVQTFGSTDNGRGPLPELMA